MKQGKALKALALRSWLLVPACVVFGQNIIGQGAQAPCPLLRRALSAPRQTAELHVLIKLLLRSTTLLTLFANLFEFETGRQTESVSQSVKSTEGRVNRQQFYFPPTTVGSTQIVGILLDVYGFKRAGSHGFERGALVYSWLASIIAMQQLPLLTACWPLSNQGHAPPGVYGRTHDGLGIAPNRNATKSEPTTPPPRAPQNPI